MDGLSGQGPRALLAPETRLMNLLNHSGAGVRLKAAGLKCLPTRITPRFRSALDKTSKGTITYSCQFLTVTESWRGSQSKFHHRVNL